GRPAASSAVRRWSCGRAAISAAPRRSSGATGDRRPRGEPRLRPLHARGGAGGLRRGVARIRALAMIRRMVNAAKETLAKPVRSPVSPAEWDLRVELAACYRLAALYRWDDLIYTHISARLPGPEHHFLINPYGMMFEEITASS